MPLLFYLPLIIWMGLFEVARDEMRVPVKAKASRLDDDDADPRRRLPRPLSRQSFPIVAISRRRARASRDITVPIGTSVASAISR
jgi:hypothetical protein